jgi:hypothetical protein
VGRRAAASSAAGKRAVNAGRKRARYAVSRAVAGGWPAESKNRARQDCFEHYYRIILSIDFRPDDISYPPVQPV